MPPRAPARAAPPPDTVACVLVAHDGDRWLPETLAAVRAQTRAPDLLLAADTGSRDASPELLRAALGEPAVVDLPRGTGFPAAVAAALQRSEREPRWVWLLHDDSAPAPDALARLLDEAAHTPSAAVLGCAGVEWAEERRLLDVGFTVDATAHRHTGLDAGELDQGQYDAPRDVLAVGSAGMLVRADAWAELGGLDPRLPLWRDDLDLCWRAHAAGHRVVVVPRAVVRHAEAATRGLRRAHVPGGRRPRRTDRVHGLTVALAHAPATRLPWLLLRLVLGGLLRALGLALGKRAGDGLDELAALAAVLGRPGRVVALRRRPGHGDVAAAREAWSLVAPAGTGVRRVRDDAARVTARLAERLGLDEVAAARPVESGPSELDESLAPGGLGLVLRRLVLRPSVALATGLLVLGVVAGRHLLTGGDLSGGALLPVPPGSRDLWHAFTAGWAPVGPGGDAPARPWLAVLAGLALLTAGSARALAAVLLVVGPALAGASAYACGRRLLPARWPRVALAAAYALLPGALGAVATGRIGVAAVHVLLPPLALAVARAGEPSRDGARRVALAGLLAVPVVALAPSLAPALLVTAAVTAGGPWGRRALVVAGVVLVPLLALAPWSLGLLAHPSRAVAVPGTDAAGLADPRLQPWRLALAWPGGPGLPLPAWTGLPLLLAGLVGVGRRRPAVAARALAGGGAALLTGLLVSRASVPAPGGALSGWPGPAALAVGLALLAATAVALRDGVAALRGTTFSWRQPAAALLAAAWLLALAGAVVGWAARGSAGPVGRHGHDVRPAFVAAEAQGGQGPRTLVVAAGSRDRYALVRAAPPGLAEAGALPRRRAAERLDAAVSDLLAGRGDAAVERLAAFGVRRVALVPPVDPATVTRLDATPSLSRSAAEGGELLWQVVPPAGRLVLLDPDAAAVAVTGADVDPATVAAHPAQPLDGASRVVVPAGPPGRLLVLAESAERGWTARLGRDPLPRATAWGWAQAFPVPPEGGVVRLAHRSPRVGWEWGAGLVLLAAALVAAPPARRRPDEPVHGPARRSAS